MAKCTNSNSSRTGFFFTVPSTLIDAVAVDLDAVVNAIICFCGDTTIMIIIPAGTHPLSF